MNICSSSTQSRGLRSNVTPCRMVGVWRHPRTANGWQLALALGVQAHGVPASCCGMSSGNRFSRRYWRKTSPWASSSTARWSSRRTTDSSPAATLTRDGALLGALAFSPDAKALYVAGADQKITLYDVVTWKPLAQRQG